MSSPVRLSFFLFSPSILNSIFPPSLLSSIPLSQAFAQAVFVHHVQPGHCKQITELRTLISSAAIILGFFLKNAKKSCMSMLRLADPRLCVHKCVFGHLR